MAQAQRTICNVHNNSENSLKVPSTHHSWVGKFDFKGAQQRLESGSSTIFFHHEDDKGKDAAAVVIRGKDRDGDQDVDFLLAWDNPAEGMKRVLADIAKIGKYDDPDWDQIRNKLSTSKADVTVTSNELGCVCHVQITQLHPVKFKAVISHIV